MIKYHSDCFKSCRNAHLQISCYAADGPNWFRFLLIISQTQNTNIYFFRFNGYLRFNSN